MRKFLRQCSWCNLDIYEGDEVEIDHNLFHKDVCEEAYREYCREKIRRMNVEIQKNKPN